jgi:hypothetical protein
MDSISTFTSSSSSSSYMNRNMCGGVISKVEYTPARIAFIVVFLTGCIIASLIGAKVIKI